MGVTSKGMASSDETTTFDNGVVEQMRMGGATVRRATFQPGWQWSENVKPMAKTDLCQTHHVGYLVSGRLGIATDDGAEAEIGAGEAYDIEPGHDGWVIGDEPVIMVEFSLDVG